MIDIFELFSDIPEKEFQVNEQCEKCGGTGLDSAFGFCEECMNYFNGNETD
ncbi:hypothetical protein SAMN04487944_109129 [Gracilibacillus ureilyticus]|uniref:Uncharacterized protein n=1 Tax=Gracilibacillus ureilyticus TaxID=531814 RepID=A0A1H9RRV9_9BACI|nr:hypothetical protein [Gracilibacillus ureilyticus]SER75436.1 hypothetical protein SAMN04487944_109129 [Gracilibacillus ureilyticus]